MTKFLLDSGDPQEYEDIAHLAKEKGSELWGATTNPSLIAKKLQNTKVHSKQEAFELQKDIVLQILDIVPGAVSAEVYADEKTTAAEMIEQGKDIATWHERIYVKLPTTKAGLKARTELRQAHIPINNTLVFTQEQIFAICLHEKLCQKEFGPIENKWPPFISPFVGRLDDRGENGMDLVRNGMDIKESFDTSLWMLEASVRSIGHMQAGIHAKSELITAPSKMYEEWFGMSEEQRVHDRTDEQNTFTPLPLWEIPQELMEIDSIEKFFSVIDSGKLNITHELTESGLVRFAGDWNAIIQYGS